MAPPIPQLKREEIEPLIEGVFHKGRSAGQADLYALKWDGQEALLKDFSTRPAWIRFFWGRFVIAREFRVMRRLWGVEGIPKVLATVGSYGILMERLNAVRIPHRTETAPPIEFFDRASELVRTIHARGIGHGDLRRKNILIDAEGRPYLIDFATAVSVKPGITKLVLQPAFRFYERIDAFQLAEMKADFYEAQLSEEEREALDHPPWYMRFGWFFKKRVLRLRKARHRRKLRRKFWKWWYRGGRRQQ